ncbi:hypothetical protein KUTeg_017789 [Tegillarca granosa]|uniref:G-protein coupled receptors family 1 profile domain-containing protein n=1 Tax=Tegillarca granosa TaxID=220873 RepID=A0ABQ9EFY7_TEGGR|nr:hypothetical protein KUTeg_017789 [Tegillarca granosa]
MFYVVRFFKAFKFNIDNIPLFVVGAFLFSWIPYTLYSIVSMSDATQHLPAIISTIPSFAAKTSVVWNPIIYIYRNKKFRIAILETFPCLQSCFNFRTNCSKSNDNVYTSVLDSAEQGSGRCNCSLKLLDSNGSPSKQTEFALVEMTAYKDFKLILMLDEITD